MRQRGSGCLRALAAAWILTELAPVARAAPPSSPRAVRIERGSCDAVPWADVMSAARVELAGRLGDEAPAADAYDAALRCDDNAVAISVRRGDGRGEAPTIARFGGAPPGEMREVRVALAHVPRDIRARVVAIALAELIRDLDREPAAPSPPPAPPAPPPSRVPVAPSAGEAPATSLTGAERPASLAAFAAASRFGAGGVWLEGGGLRFDYARRRISAGIDVALLGTSERFAPGTAQAMLVYGSPTIAWREAWGFAETRVGAGYALGAATLSGRADATGAFSGTTTGAWSAPYAFASLRLAVFGPVGVEVRGHLGWITSAVVGDVTGGGQVALQGLWAGGQAAVTISL